MQIKKFITNHTCVKNAAKALAGPFIFIENKCPTVILIVASSFVSLIFPDNFDPPDISIPTYLLTISIKSSGKLNLFTLIYSQKFTLSSSPYFLAIPAKPQWVNLQILGLPS